MVGTRQLERVLSHAAEAGAKVVLVGDPQQLQAIEAGAAFRSIYEHHGGTEIGEVRRQREDWQRNATRDLANGKTGNALEAYRSHDMVHEAPTRERARGDLIDRWDRDRQASPDQSRIILTHTNDEVRALNEAARERMRAAGDLGDELRVTVERGARNFASGDRVMYLQNERGLGVKNGTLGTIEQVNEKSMSVRTDDGRSVHFDLKDYNKIDHGYAATILGQSSSCTSGNNFSPWATISSSAPNIRGRSASNFAQKSRSRRRSVGGMNGNSSRIVRSARSCLLTKFSTPLMIMGRWASNSCSS